MKLCRQQIDHWPRLSWFAKATDDSVNVLHGCRVECSEEWVFEGTWAGEFGRGDFDRGVPVIIGTGIRLRGNTVSFVCSTGALDRLFYVKRKKGLLISNSLACLLSVAKLRLDPAFPYSKTLLGYLNNHRHQPKILPTLDGDEIHFLTYEKLVYSKKSLEEQTHAEETFTSFEEYEGFLHTRILAIRANLQDEQRRFKVAPVATISKGYDSAASAAIAKPLGIRTALTISCAGKLRHDDSGKEIAEKLGIPVKSVIERRSAYRDYDLVFAGLGLPGDLNMTLFDYPDDLTLLVVGTAGDFVWQNALNQEFNDSHHFLDRHDTTSCQLAEWRLHKGVFLANLPSIGASRFDCLKQINDSPAMDPWRIGGNYDRPIPRRILEQQGVRRGTFGIKKMGTIAGYSFYPSDPDQRIDLEAFLEQHGKCLPRKLGKFTEHVHWLRKKLEDIARKKKFEKLARFVQFPDYDDLFFVWANNRLAKNNYSVVPQESVVALEI
ncbi:MAG TPA: hypothetical protein DD706_14635 [Nitrospiraceae bacterium]|nr:hypothetical protein [Nitrospiraceae bacterium]